MLYQLGALTIEVVPFNTNNVENEYGHDFAAKDVVGAQRPREDVGIADETLKFECRVFPHKFGGLDEMEILRGMSASGSPQIVVRGDGRNMGWFLVEKVHEKHASLDAQGVGRDITVSIDLTQSPQAASPAAMLSMLMSLFG